MYAAQAPVVEYIAPAPAVYAAPAPVAPAPGSAHQVTADADAEVETFNAYVGNGVKTRRKTMATSSVRCTCTCRGVRCAGSSYNLRRASTGSGILGASAFNPCRYL